MVVVDLPGRRRLDHPPFTTAAAYRGARLTTAAPSGDARKRLRGQLIVRQVAGALQVGLRAGKPSNRPENAETRTSERVPGRGALERT